MGHPGPARACRSNPRLRGRRGRPVQAARPGSDNREACDGQPGRLVRATQALDQELARSGMTAGAVVLLALAMVLFALGLD